MNGAGTGTSRTAFPELGGDAAELTREARALSVSELRKIAQAPGRQGAHDGETLRRRDLPCRLRSRDSAEGSDLQVVEVARVPRDHEGVRGAHHIQNAQVTALAETFWPRGTYQTEGVCRVVGRIIMGS